MHPAGCDARMIHEIASHEIVAIAQAGGCLPIGDEQKSRILDASSGKDKASRAHGEYVASQCLDVNLLRCDRGRIGDNVGDVCVQQDINIRRTLQFCAKDFAGTQGWAELRYTIDQRLAGKGISPHIRAIDRFRPIPDIVVVDSQLKYRLRALVIWRKFLRSEWPAAVRNPAAAFVV